MRFNAKKCHSILFEKHVNFQTDTHKLDGSALEIRGSFNYLVVIITKDFHWDNQQLFHQKRVVSKANRTLGYVEKIPVWCHAKVKVIGIFTIAQVLIRVCL